MCLGGGMTDLADLELSWEMFAGDSDGILIPLTGDDGEPYGLYGATAKWALARSAKHTPVLEKDTDDGITIDDEAGTITIPLLPEDTAELADGLYYHELELTELDGTVKTLMFGQITLRASGV
jgi:hypothetical protein